jgi:hypothetical protein
MVEIYSNYSAESHILILELRKNLIMKEEKAFVEGFNIKYGS